LTQKTEYEEYIGNCGMSRTARMKMEQKRRGKAK
jgi:hypothetical protein